MLALVLGFPCCDYYDQSNLWRKGTITDYRSTVLFIIKET